MARRGSGRRAVKGDTEASPRGPRLLVVRDAYTLHWPHRSLPVRGGAGTVVAEDDPLLDTSRLPDEVRERHHLLVSDQHFKCRAAAAGSQLTPHMNSGAQKVYDEVGYDAVAFQAPDDTPPPKTGATHAAAPPRQRTDVQVPAVDE